MEAASVRGNGNGVSSQGRIDPGVQPGAGLESTVPMLLPETSIDGRVLPLPSVLLGSPRTAPQGGQESEQMPRLGQAKKSIAVGSHNG